VVQKKNKTEKRLGKGEVMKLGGDAKELGRSDVRMEEKTLKLGRSKKKRLKRGGKEKTKQSWKRVNE